MDSGVNSTMYSGMTSGIDAGKILVWIRVWFLESQIDLWLRFWGPWVARMQTRAQLEHGSIDSIMVLARRPFKCVIVGKLMLKSIWLHLCRPKGKASVCLWFSSGLCWPRGARVIVSEASWWPLGKKIAKTMSKIADLRAVWVLKRETMFYRRVPRNTQNQIWGVVGVSARSKVVRKRDERIGLKSQIWLCFDARIKVLQASAKKHIRKTRYEGRLVFQRAQK